VTSAGLRRLAHAGTAVVLLLVPAFSWTHLRWTLTAGALLAVVADAIRLTNPEFRTWVERAVPLFRPSEAHRLSGAACLALAYAVAAWFPPPVPAAAILVGALADPAASWIGSRAGGGARKSWPGTGAAWAAGVLALLGLGYTWPVAGGVAAVGAGLERWSIAWDDNLAVAPGVGLVVFLLA
jgi:dolichol kinase